jgi:hypothetical protein
MSEDRLRRQLQAQAVVNRQLHAQLAEVTAELRAVQGNDASTVRILWRRIEAVLPGPVASRVERRVRGALGAPVRASARRVGAPREGPTLEWLEDLRRTPPPDVEPSLARSEDDEVFVLEGTLRRPVHRMLIVALLETELGPARELTAADLEQYDEGPPVEVLAPPGGVPFLVLSGRRRPIAGYPVPFPIEDHDAGAFVEGAPLRIAHIGQVLKKPPPVRRSPLSKLGRLRELWIG